MKHLTAGLVVALLSIGGLAACGDDDDAGGGAASTAAANAETTAGATTTAAATGAIDPSKPEVRLAYIGIKVPGINLYDGQLRGVEAATKKINDAGGFGGRKLVVDPCNSAAQPAVATTCAQRTVAKNPIAEFGCEVSWGASGLKIYAGKGIPSFNCTTLPEDYSNPYSFGIHPGEGLKGRAEYFCQQPDIKSVSYITIDIPQQRTVVKNSFTPTLEACGKKVYPVFYPATAVDLTPSINAVVSKKADFNFVNATGPQAVVVVKGFKSAGIASDKIAMGESSWDYNVVVKPLGDALEGTYYMGGWAGWGDTENPDIQGYLAAMQADGNSVETARDPNAEYGFAETMFFYEAAKEIGFDTFDAASLKEFASTNNGLHIPLARTLVNPGPKGFEQVKQTYIQVAQYKGGKMIPVTEGTDEGWVNGY